MTIYANGNKSNCCACGACVNVCTKNAISMQADEYGFLYPYIDQALCVGCDLCKAACDKVNKNESSMLLKAFAGVHKNEHILRQSSSGGVFPALAEHFLSINGAVCGCVFDDKLNAIHICAEKEQDVLKMRKSKYVQSNVGFVYRDVKKRLRQGQPVLFTGTPCQVAALYAVTGCGYDNLTTVDLVCHGVPSQLCFDQFVKYLEKRYKTKIIDFDFRSKKYGWPRFTMEFTDSNHRTVNIGKAKEFYIPSFTGGNIIRDSCLSCKYACPNRIGDITIGDLWGYEKLGLNLNVSKGLSVFTINKPAAMKWLDVLSDKLVCEEVDYRDAINGNTCLHQPTSAGGKRNLYLQSLKENNIEKMAIAYRRRTKKTSFREKIKLMLPAPIFNFFRKRFKIKQAR